MHALNDSDILSVWERGIASQPVYQALTLLAFACSEMPVETLAGLSIGQRDSLLLELREMTFGSRLSCLARCPGCGDQLDMAFDISEIRASPKGDSGQEHSLQVSDFSVKFRLPNSLDLAAIAKCRDVSSARQILLYRSILSARHEGEEISPDLLPRDVVGLMVKRMEEVDPQADIQFYLSCPSCSIEWNQTFDVVSFLWSEIDFWARRLLEEVNTLAGAYGWSESDILALSSQRRAIYLEMANR